MTRLSILNKNKERFLDGLAFWSVHHKLYKKLNVIFDKIKKDVYKKDGEMLAK